MRNMYMCYGVFDMLKAIMHTVWELFNDTTFGPISISLSLSLSLFLSHRLMRENAQVKYAKVIQPLHPRGKLVFTTKSVVGLYAIHGPHTLPPTLNKRSVFNIYRSSVLWNNPNNEVGSSKWRKRKQGKRKKPHERPLFHLKKKKKSLLYPAGWHMTNQ